MAPYFPCWNSYTAAMIGDHCIAAIGDAYIKGVRNFDIEKAYEAMRKMLSNHLLIKRLSKWNGTPCTAIVPKIWLHPIRG